MMLNRARRVLPAACCVLTLAAWGAKPPVPAAPKLTPEERSAKALLSKMSLHDKVAQLVFIVHYGDVYNRKSAEYEKYRHLVADARVGGIIVVNSTENGVARYAEPHGMATFLNQMQRLARTPLMIGADFERGASMRIRNAVTFPYAMAYGAADDVEAARFEGMFTAREARALGIHWVFAPVADVNNNPENPVINIRSYSENPDQVAKLVSAFIQGAHSDPNNRVLVTAKHFPGHGDTGVNSHIGLPSLSATREHMDEVELKPFQAAIAAGVDSIMTAHMIVPALEEEEIPATTSPKVLTDLLRNQLHFKELIVTDAMDMGGLTRQFNNGEAAVRSLMAGADVLLMPPDPERAIRAVVDAVNAGRISQQRIDQSAQRLLAAKIRVGLMKRKFVDLDSIADVMASPEAVEKAQQVSDHAVTLLKNEGSLIPLAPRSHSCLVLTMERRTSGVGVKMIQEFQRRAPEGRVFLLDSSLPRAALEAAVSDAGTCSALVIVSSVSPGTQRKDYTLAGDLGPFVKGMTEGTVPTVLVSLGSPYLITAFPQSSAYLATFSPTVSSETSAVKALFGEIPITGKVPVGIPGFAQPGDGIQLPVRVR